MLIVCFLIGKKVLYFATLRFTARRPPDVEARACPGPSADCQSVGRWVGYVVDLTIDTKKYRLFVRLAHA